MQDEVPDTFLAAAATWVAAQQGETLRHRAGQLQAAYQAGQSSAAVDLLTYLTIRAPATHAAITAVLAKTAECMPGFAPAAILDVGAGPGTASHAAWAQWPSLQRFTLVEQDARFAAAARALGETRLPGFDLRQHKLQSLAQKADLVIAAYVLAEIPLNEIGAITQKLWSASAALMIIIEPGTPQGFARIRAARQQALKQGAHIIGPCTHAQACPVQNDDWCHFKTRLARSRAHMHAKNAVVPFEDEAFSWLAVARNPVPLPLARVVAPVLKSKIGLSTRLCSAAGLAQTTIAARDKPAYKAARHLKWGDAYDPAVPHGQTKSLSP